jgi:hypothetical protein
MEGVGDGGSWDLSVVNVNVTALSCVVNNYFLDGFTQASEAPRR